MNVGYAFGKHCNSLKPCVCLCGCVCVCVCDCIYWLNSQSYLAWLFNNLRLLAPVQRQPSNMRQVYIITSCISSYRALLLELLLFIDVDWTISEVCTYTASLSHAHKRKTSFHKLIRMIQIFLSKTYIMVQHYPWNIDYIELFQTDGT